MRYTRALIVNRSNNSLFTRITHWTNCVPICILASKYYVTYPMNIIPIYNEGRAVRWKFQNHNFNTSKKTLEDSVLQTRVCDDEKKNVYNIIYKRTQGFPLVLCIHHSCLPCTIVVFRERFEISLLTRRPPRDDPYTHTHTLAKFFIRPNSKHVCFRDDSF